MPKFTTKRFLRIKSKWNGNELRFKSLEINLVMKKTISSIFHQMMPWRAPLKPKTSCSYQTQIPQCPAKMAIINFRVYCSLQSLCPLSINDPLCVLYINPTSGGLMKRENSMSRRRATVCWSYNLMDKRPQKVSKSFPFPHKNFQLHSIPQ